MCAASLPQEPLPNRLSGCGANLLWTALQTMHGVLQAGLCCAAMLSVLLRRLGAHAPPRHAAKGLKQGCVLHSQREGGSGEACPCACLCGLGVECAQPSKRMEHS